MTDTAPAAVLDDDGLTEQYKRAVTDALPAGVTPPDEFWRDLESAIGAFLALQQHRTDQPAKLQLKRWQNIERLVDNLAKELRTIRSPHRGGGDFGFDQLAPDRALAALWPIKRKAEAGMLGYQMINTEFRGRNNPYRQVLYGNVLDLWRRHLGQELGISRSEQGIPRGPLINFLGACIGPVLGAATPTASGFASIIYREQRKLRAFAGVDAAGGTGVATASGSEATSVLDTEK